MSSSVFFRFKSQKEPNRVTFDGTGISVFELKREIILASKLGDGTDFELVLSSVDGSEVYDDDTTIIPRSTTVIAKRLPATRPGKGGAARYVSGKAPVHAKNSHRSENAQAGAKTQASAATATIGEAQTEEERMAAVLQMGSDQWSQQKREMASATPVFRPGGKGKAANVPDRPLPPGYVCYRCGEKGHWIQECPTNDDPNFQNQRRLKRTTGIPKSFLKTVEKPTNLADGSTEAPAGVMINAEGDWVIAEPDKASWEQFQAKANKNTAAQQEVDTGLKEIQDKGLACPIDKRLFVDPSKTPCCQTTFCNECITNALLENELQCPHCDKEGVLIDDLKPDTDMATRIREYEEEKAKQQAAAAAEAEATAKAEDEDQKPSDTAEEAKASPSATEEAVSNDVKDEENKEGDEKLATPEEDSKKRKAETELDNDRKSPAAPGDAKSEDQSKPQFPPELDFMNQPLFANNGNGNDPNAMGVDMNMMGMNPMMMNPMFAQMMMMQNMAGMGNMGNMPNMPNMGNTGNMGNMGFGFPMQGMMPQQQQQQGNQGAQSRPAQPPGMQGVPTGPRAQTQQRNNFNGGQQQNGGDSPYMRQPVNPRRGGGRRNFQRPADYREI